MTSSVIGVSWFLQVNFWPPYSKTPVQLICVFASMTPSSRPAMADRTLKVEPGGYTPLVTRFTSGWRLSLVRSSAAEVEL